jgi:SHS2 domain-containing protein
MREQTRYAAFNQPLEARLKPVQFRFKGTRFHNRIIEESRISRKLTGCRAKELVDISIWYTFAMNTVNPAGFREVEHTADWELQVWAPDLPTLLEQAARGMYHLQGLQLKSSPRREHSFVLAFQDIETLLVDFLAELLYLSESEELGFDLFALKISNHSLQAELSGASINYVSKEIKAVTYHNLIIRKTSSGLEANVVFDV